MIQALLDSIVGKGTFDDDVAARAEATEEHFLVERPNMGTELVRCW